MDANFIVITTIIDFLIFGLISDIDTSNNITIYVLIVSLLINIFALNLNKNKFKKHIQISMILRFIFMIIDVYYSDIINLPNSGIDSENYYKAGLTYSKYDSIFNYKLYGGLYSKIIGTLFKVIGDNRLFIQYINIILSILTILILIKVLDYIDIDKQIKKIVILIICYFPNNVLISALLLRESWIIFLTTIGLLLYVKYQQFNKLEYLLFSALAIVAASLFHSGVIMILFGFILNEILFQGNRKIMYSIIGTVLILVMIFLFKNIIFTKFSTQIQILTSNDDYLSEAGSRYLPSIYINSLTSAFKYIWIKSIYFIASPTPLYWRGLIDMLSFILDSLFYIVVSIKVIFNIKELKKIEIVSNYTYTGLIISLSLCIAAFAIGTSTAGTAIRHRNKLLPLFLIIYATIENYKLKDKNKGLII